MRLVYKECRDEVEIGDIANGMKVEYFSEPHKPASEGKVTVNDGSGSMEYYVSVIGAVWIERGDK